MQIDEYFMQRRTHLREVYTQVQRICCLRKFNLICQLNGLNVRPNIWVLENLNKNKSFFTHTSSNFGTQKFIFSLKRGCLKTSVYAYLCSVFYKKIIESCTTPRWKEEGMQNPTRCGTTLSVSQFIPGDSLRR